MPDYCCLCGTESSGSPAACTGCGGTVFHRRHCCLMCSRMQYQAECMTCRTRSLPAANVAALLQTLVSSEQHLRAWDLAVALQSSPAVCSDPLVSHMHQSCETFRKNVLLWMQGHIQASEISSDALQAAVLQEFFVVVGTRRGLVAVPLFCTAAAHSHATVTGATGLWSELAEKYIPTRWRTGLPPLLHAIWSTLLLTGRRLGVWRRDWLQPRLVRIVEAGESWGFAAARHPLIHNSLPAALQWIRTTVSEIYDSSSRSHFLNEMLPETWRKISNFVIRIPHAAGQTRQPDRMLQILEQPVRFLLTVLRSEFLQKQVPAAIRDLRQSTSEVYLNIRRSHFVTVILPNWLNQIAGSLRSGCHKS